MPMRRVVLLSNRSILASGIQRLLEEAEGVALSVIKTDDPEWPAKLARTVPRVIVLDSGDASLGEGGISHLLEEHPRAKIIALNLNHTGMDVYRMKRVVPTDLEGLLHAIHGRTALAQGNLARRAGER